MAREKMRSFLRSPAALHNLNIEQSNVRDFLDSWLERRRPRLADKTWRSYESIIRVHLKTHLGNLDPAKVTSLNVSNALAAMKLTTGERTRELAYIILKSAFRKINPDLLADVDKPKPKKKPINPWNAEQSEKFLGSLGAESHELSAFFRLALTSGARQGELIALSHDDLNLRTGDMRVRQKWNETAAALEAPTPRRSIRSIDLSVRTVDALRQYRADLKLRLESMRKNRLRKITAEIHALRNDPAKSSTSRGVTLDQCEKALKELNATSPFFFAQIVSDRFGEKVTQQPLDPRNLSKSMEEAMSKAGVPIIRFHDLRHTFATLGLSADVSPKVMADILGHASVQITLDLYSHVMPGMQQTAVDAIDAKLLEAAKNLDQPDAAGRSGDQAAA